MNEAKPFCISKKEVWEAYLRVRSNKGAAGIDGQSIEDFEKELKKNLFKIWNRMSSGSYFPPPVRTVKIPKKSGGERSLGIPTVADRVAQQVVKARVNEAALKDLIRAAVALNLKGKSKPQPKPKIRPTSSKRADSFAVGRSQPSQLVSAYKVCRVVRVSRAFIYSHLGIRT